MMAQVWFFRVSCLLGASSVILGAFAAHGLKQRLSPEMLSVFEVGVRYQMYHALAMLAVTLAVPRLWSSPWTAAACSAWLFGIVIFSGSLYLLALTGIKFFGAITPIGGVALLLGWLALLGAAARILAPEG